MYTKSVLPVVKELFRASRKKPTKSGSLDDTLPKQDKGVAREPGFWASIKQLYDPKVLGYTALQSIRNNINKLRAKKEIEYIEKGGKPVYGKRPDIFYITEEIILKLVKPGHEGGARKWWEKEVAKVKGALPKPPVDSAVETRILLADGSYINGLAEPDLLKGKIGQIIQFERYAFCRIESIDENKVDLIWTHR